MANDRTAAFKWLKKNGWTALEDGRGYVAEHPDANAEVKFGGSLGWNLQAIRKDCLAALGQRAHKPNRQRAEKAARAAESDARKAAWRDAALAHRRGAGREFYAWADAVVSRPGWSMTAHARERMVERGISMRDLSEAMREGVINLDKQRDGRTLPVWHGRRATVVADAIDMRVVTVYAPGELPAPADLMRRPRAVS